MSTGTSSIRGTVTDAVTKEPLEGCTVRAGSLNRFGEAKSGADGSYEFAGIADGSYWQTAQCPTYLRTCVEPEERPDFAVQPRMVCTDVALFRDQQRANVGFRMVRAAVVRGRVTDSTGKPVARAEIRIGGGVVGNALVAMNMGTTTKDDGTYELNALAEGAWRISVEVPPQPGAYSSTTVFYPGVLHQDDSGVVDVVTGKTKENVDIVVPPVLTSVLTVRVPPPDGTVTSVAVSIIRTSPLMTRSLEIDAEGRAAATGLTTGRYYVLATAVAGDQQWADYQPVDFLDGSVDVSLQPRPTGRIRGRIVADRGGLPPLEGTGVAAAWVEDGTTLNPLAPDDTMVTADGTFEIDKLFGRRTLELLRFGAEWQIKSVMMGRIDLTTGGVDVATGSTIDVKIVVGRR